MTDLEKRLIALQAHGIWIEHADGHRHIRCKENYGGYDFDLDLNKNGISVNNKIYGGVEEALDVVDEALLMLGRPNLLQYFDDLIDEEYGVRYKDEPHGRISIVKGNRGGLN